MKKLALLLLVLIPILGMSQIEKTFNNVKIQDTAKVSRITPLPGRSGFFIDADTTTIGDRTLSGSQKLNVDGAVKVGATTNGTTGTIEYAGSDFWFHTSDSDSTALSDLVGGGESVWTESGDTAIYSSDVKVGETKLRGNDITKQFQTYDGVSWLGNDDFGDNRLWVTLDSIDNWSGTGETYEFVIVRYPFNDNSDLVQFGWTHEYYEDNLLYNYGGTYKIPNTTLYTSAAMAAADSIVLPNNDDINPVWFANSYWAGANHGFLFPVVIKSSHGKTNDDIGSIWSDSYTQFRIAEIISSDSILFIPVAYYGYSNLTYWYMDRSITGTTLTHVSGATNTGDITSFTSANPQAYKSIKNHSLQYLINGTEPLTLYKSTYCKFLRVIESYDIIDPTTFTYSYPFSYTSGSSWATQYNVYDYYVGGVTEYHKVKVNRPADIRFVGFSQMGKPAEATSITNGFWDDILMYVPKIGETDGYDFAEIDTINSAPAGTIYFDNTVWDDSNDPPNRMVYFLKRDGESKASFGVAHGINIEYPDMRNSDRYENDTAALFSASGNGKFTNGIACNFATDDTIITGIVYRRYFDPMQYQNSIATYWTKEGNYWYVYSDYNSVVDNDTIELPDFLNGKEITVVESDSVSLESGYTVINSIVIVSCTASQNGYIRLRLSGNYIERPSTVVFETPKKRVLLDYIELQPQQEIPVAQSINNGLIWVDSLDNLIYKIHNWTDTLSFVPWRSYHYRFIYDQYDTVPDFNIALSEDSLVYTLEQIGAWDELDGFVKLASNTVHNAMIDWIHPTEDSISYGLYSPTFTDYEGALFTPANSNINTNHYLPTQTNYKQDDCILGIYCRTNTNDNYYWLSANGGGAYIFLNGRNSSNNMTFSVNNNGTGLTQANPDSDSKGMYIIARTSSTAQTINRNKTLTSKTTTSVGVPTTTLRVGNYSYPCQDQLSLFFWGGYMDETMQNQIIDAFEKHMDYLGKGVIP